MTNVRQDAWSEEDDLLLAETVLRHVREGSTQLLAFEEVGDKLDRTSAAVGFRWNAIVRKKYEQALKIARRQRKERKRAAAGQSTQKQSDTKSTYQSRFDDPIDFENYHPLSEPKNRTMNTETAAETTVPRNSVVANEERIAQPITQEQTVKEETSVGTNLPLSLEVVIEFLQNMNVEQTSNSTSLQQRNERLEQECNTLRMQNQEIEASLKELTENYSALKEDYQALLQIMDRARRMVLLQDQDEMASPKFKMDKNGNLEKLAK